MNFLAHCLIADQASRSEAESDGLLAGAVLGDFIKGQVPAHWSETLKLGVRLHRRVDAVSNRNAGLRQSANRFSTELRRFAPIYLDLMADHLLSLSWAHYHQQGLGDFCQRCYAALTPEFELMSPDARRFAGYMIEHDLLSRYGDWQSIERAATHISRRLQREHLTIPILETLQSKQAVLTADFTTYFPEIAAAGQAFVASASAEQ